MGTLKRLIAVTGCLLAGLLCSNSASATTFYWIKGGVGNYASASAACPSTASLYNLTFTFDGVHFYSAESATCNYKYTSPEGNVSTDTLYALSRVGDSCPQGAIYNETTGGCSVVAPTKQPGEKCDDQTGGTQNNPMIWDGTTNSCVQFTASEGEAPCKYLKSVGDANPNYAGTKYKVIGVISSTGEAVAPPTFADSAINCEVSTVTSSDCRLTVGGTTTCNVLAKFNGNVNPGGTVDAASDICEPNCPPEEPKTSTKDEPCVPIGNGSGGTSCTQTKETSKDGSQQCGSFNGAYTCVTKKPGSNGVITGITSTSETLPDGSIKVTTVKNSANMVCTDVNTCTTSHSTTTTHSTTSPSGSTKTDSTCTGKCTANGGGVETIPGAGTGGTGSGNGEGEEEPDQGTASVTDNCLAPPPCEGDVFQCAILGQQHMDTCKIMADVTPEQVASQTAKINAVYTALDQHQAELDSQVNTLLGEFMSATSGGTGGGAQCMPDVPISVMGHTVTMEFAKACEAISFVRYAVLAMAYLFAARIIFREV